MKKIIALLVLLPSLAFAQATETTSNAVGTGTSQAAAQNAGNAQNIQFNSQGGGHSQLVATPNVQGNAFYGSVSPDGCSNSQGGGASGWLFGANVVLSHDMATCYGLRVYERTMQWVVNLPVQKPYAAYKGLLREDGMDMASDELCLMNDRVRVLMERRGLCQNIKDVPTYDHTGWDSEARQFDRSYAASHQQLQQP
jgi:hypothetical protein